MKKKGNEEKPEAEKGRRKCETEQRTQPRKIELREKKNKL